MYFFARHKLQLLLGLSHQLKEEIFAVCLLKVKKVKKVWLLKNKHY